MILGCHLSAAGGPANALERAAALKLDTVALFVRQHRQWRSKPLSPEAVELFRAARRRHRLKPVIAHSSYLINLAGDEPVRTQSMMAMADELQRCLQLGIDYYVFHPGSPGPAGEEVGIERIARALDHLTGVLPPSKLRILLETTVGAGNQVGDTFEELAGIIGRVGKPELLGICLDTCHVFASGYDMRSPRAYADTMSRLDRLVGLERLCCIHLNDSMFPLGSRRDRHEHIGQGHIGREGFLNLVKDPRLARVPMILETPKGLDEEGRNLDAINVAAMRRLARRRKH